MRLSFALSQGLDPGKKLIVLRPPAGYDFGGIKPVIIHRNVVAARYWQEQGLRVSQEPMPADAVLVCVSRAKAHTQALIEQASRFSTGLVIVDGDKRDGVDSLYHSLAKRGEIAGNVTKARGRLFWFRDMDVSDWASAPQTVDGLSTVPGLFSAQRIDPGSAMLASALPSDLAGHVADFGAGWGYLTREILRRGAARVTAIEAELDGVEAISSNLSDPRLQVVWEDATIARGPFDTVVTNPPFHRGRADSPELGQAFIRSAARSLKPRGALWVVANRHLPYEKILSSAFHDVNTVQSTGSYKVFHAVSPRKI